MQASYDHGFAGQETFDMNTMSDALSHSPPYHPLGVYPHAYPHASPWRPAMPGLHLARPSPVDWRHSTHSTQHGAFGPFPNYYPPWPHALSLSSPLRETAHQHPFARRPERVGQAPPKYHTPDSSASPSSQRGPPRKPKRSGYAVWVGNLPSFARVIDLKDHFSIGLTQDIESVFLISKSTCAFVNYRTESAASAAVDRFQNSRFLGKTLSCKLRISTSPARLSATGDATPPLSPVAASDSGTGEQPARRLSGPLIVGDGANSEAKASLAPTHSSESATQKVPQKFFILKSLTIQDLEVSKANNTWATQPHNEDALNKAYAEAEAVYLIFSVNKSGEYYGYAHMASTITRSPAAPRVDSITQDKENEAGHEALTFITPATATAPRGRVVDDSERGTIFWESIRPDDDESDNSEARDPMNREEDSIPSSFPGTFAVEWVSFRRVPFYRTRGMRNPWNGHKEIKIARDGTEIEPQTGERLLQMFHLA